MHLLLRHLLLRHLALLALVASSAARPSAHAAEAASPAFAVEIDPATLAFAGYGIHIRFAPKRLPGVTTGVGAYAMDFPDFLVAMNPENADEGWKARLDMGLGLFSEYHFTAINQGWFAGTQAGIQRFAIEKRSVAGTARFTNLLLMGYGGYAWRVFDSGFYVKPWAGIGYTSTLSGKTVIGGARYDVLPITGIATLHLGYMF
ncbi:MAG: hypothetical protein JF616_18035 [Fibrobacteres bacterium]|jgi:hypothetical protein|nr:hypothetical protein [Fibrobacterota bacterium]